jgi:hypothetical protein
MRRKIAIVVVRVCSTRWMMFLFIFLATMEGERLKQFVKTTVKLVMDVTDVSSDTFSWYEDSETVKAFKEELTAAAAKGDWNTVFVLPEGFDAMLVARNRAWRKHIKQHVPEFNYAEFERSEREKGTWLDDKDYRASTYYVHHAAEDTDSEY